MQVRRKVVSGLAVWVVLACGGPDQPPVIGVAFQGTGLEALRVARDELASWSLPIELAFDSTVTGDPAHVEVARAQRLVDLPGLVALVGHGGSRATLAAAPVYNDAEIPQVAPTSTSRLLASAGPWTFSLARNDSIEGAFIGDYVAGPLRARSSTIYFVNDEYGEGLRDGVRARLREHGVAILDEVAVHLESDFSTLVEASLRRGVPDAVVVAARWTETAAIARMMTSRFPHVRVVTGDGALLLPGLSDSLGAAAAATYVVSFWLPDPADSVNAAYVARFRRVTGRDPHGVHAMTHDAIMVLAAAIRDVGADPDRIRRYLLSLGRERPPHPGVTGPVSFGPDRTANFVMTQIRDGQLVRATP